MLIISPIQRSLNWALRPVQAFNPLTKKILAFTVLGSAACAAWWAITAINRHRTFNTLLGRIQHTTTQFKHISFLNTGDQFQCDREKDVVTHYTTREKEKRATEPVAKQWLSDFLVDANKERSDLVLFVHASSNIKVKKTALEALDLLRHHMEAAQKYIKSLFPEQDSPAMVQLEGNLKQIQGALLEVGKQIFAASPKKFTKSIPADGQDLVRDLLTGKGVDIQPEKLLQHGHSETVPGQFKKDIDRLDTVWVCKQELYGKKRGIDAAYSLYESLRVCRSLCENAAFNLAKLLVQAHFLPHDQQARNHFRPQGLTAVAASGQMIAIDFDNKGNVEVFLMMIYSCKNKDADKYLPHPPTIGIARLLTIPLAELAKANYAGEGVVIEDRFLPDCVNPLVAKDSLNRYFSIPLEF